MNQEYILKIIVLAFGGVAFGAISGALAALYSLRKRTDRVLLDRMVRESHQNMPNMAIKH
jgi:hypothetical protein